MNSFIEIFILFVALFIGNMAFSIWYINKLFEPINKEKGKINDRLDCLKYRTRKIIDQYYRILYEVETKEAMEMIKNTSRYSKKRKYLVLDVDKEKDIYYIAGIYDGAFFKDDVVYTFIVNVEKRSVEFNKNYFNL